MLLKMLNNQIKVTMTNDSRFRTFVCYCLDRLMYFFNVSDKTWTCYYCHVCCLVEEDILFTTSAKEITITITLTIFVQFCLTFEWKYVLMIQQKKELKKKFYYSFFLDKSLEEMHLFNSESCKKSCLTNNFFPITDFFLSAFFNVFFLSNLKWQKNKELFYFI